MIISLIFRSGKLFFSTPIWEAVISIDHLSSQYLSFIIFTVLSFYNLSSFVCFNTTWHALHTPVHIFIMVSVGLICWFIFECWCVYFFHNDQWMVKKNINFFITLHYTAIETTKSQSHETVTQWTRLLPTNHMKKSLTNKKVFQQHLTQPLFYERTFPLIDFGTAVSKEMCVWIEK